MKHLLSLLLLAPVGCGLLDSVKATTVVGGLVVRAPDVAVAGQIEQTGNIVCTSWVGERDSPTSTEAPKPIGDATVRLLIDGASIDLPVQAADEGVYGTTSVDEAGLVYRAGAAYTFEADTIGATFGGAVDAAPTPLTPAALVLMPQPTAAHPNVPEALLHPANTALKVSWADQYGRYGYVTVLRADSTNPSQPTVVFDNRPKTAQQILTLVAGSPKTEVDIPAATFAADGIYAVVLVALEKGSTLLPNTFLGSAFLVGSGEVVVLGIDG